MEILKFKQICEQGHVLWKIMSERRISKTAFYR